MKKRILYLTRLDPRNILSWSGSNYFLLKALSQNFEVKIVGPLSNRVRIFFLFKRFFFSFFNIKYDIDRPILVAKDFARQIEKKISENDYDFILATDTYLVSFLKTSKPIYIFTDCLFDTYYSHYFKKQSVHKQNYEDGNYCERLSIVRSKKIILTSYWALHDAVRKYRISKEKLVYLPFGANLKSIPKKKEILSNIKKKNMKICNLISIGVNWKRKGMAKAIELVEKINEFGQPSKLYIVGAKPEKNLNFSTNTILTDFLDKNKLTDKIKLFKLLKNSHFHILFSESEAYGVVNAEASAFGLYTIAHEIGGISGAIKNDINGMRFSASTNINDIAKYIVNIFKNKKNFIKKSTSSRDFYDKNLNWEVIGKKLKKIIEFK
jgi:glycosyltransferase involved in cell wall biosynthesis